MGLKPIASEHSAKDVMLTNQLISELPHLTRVDRHEIGNIAGYELAICTIDSARDTWVTMLQDGISSPFQNYSWLLAWLETYPSKKRINPFVVLAYKQGKPAFLLPLMLEFSYSASRLLWLAHKNNDYNCPVFSNDSELGLSAESAEEIFRAVATFINADSVYLCKQPTKVVALENPFASFSAKPFTSKTYALNLSAGWPTVYTSARSSRTRQRERNKLNRLRAGDTVQLRCVRTLEERNELLQKALKWKYEQLDATGERNPYESNKLRDHLQQMVDHSDNVFCRLYVFERGETPLAITIGLIQSKVFNYYFSSYNPEIASTTSPGRLMMLKLVQLTTRAKFKLFDFSLGDEPYKLEFCDQVLPLTAAGFSLNLRGKLRLQLSWVRLGLKHYIKNSDRLMDFARKVNQSRKIVFKRKN